MQANMSNPVEPGVARLGSLALWRNLLILSDGFALDMDYSYSNRSWFDRLTTNGFRADTRVCPYTYLNLVGSAAVRAFNGSPSDVGRYL
jgi:hypothetical protein